MRWLRRDNKHVCIGITALTLILVMSTVLLFLFLLGLRTTAPITTEDYQQ